MKTTKHIFDSALTYEKLEKAYLAARKGKRRKEEVILFEKRREVNVQNLLNLLQNEKYRPSKYRKFYIHEPKRRMILSLPLKDRIVHQWLVREIIEPVFVKTFIFDSYACIKKKGTLKAVIRAGKFMRKATDLYGDSDENGAYIVKMDISKFFYSLDKDRIFDITARKIADKKALNLIRTVLYNETEETGIPIGNYTSQLFAGILMNELDQYCKRVLKLKFYIRYMDDFIAFVNGKEEARKVFGAMEKFVNINLGLELNPKSRYYPIRKGLKFLGYQQFYNYRLILPKSKKSLNKVLRDFDRNPDVDRIFLRLNSWQAHISHADSFRYAGKVVKPVTARIVREMLPKSRRLS